MRFEPQANFLDNSVQYRAARRFLHGPCRYALSIGGPAIVSLAHLMASVLVLRASTLSAFGLFAFLLVIVPLLLSISGALMNAPITTAVTMGRDWDSTSHLAHLKANGLYCALSAFVMLCLALAAGASLAVSAAAGLYAGAMTFRWFARSYAYRQDRPFRVALSDVIYAATLSASLSIASARHILTLDFAVAALAMSAVLSVLSFGTAYYRAHWTALRRGSLGPYAETWHRLTRWSLLGVILTEATANAHAYIVTLIAGPGAFAPIALGVLFLRPASLALSALPDAERPRMAMAIAAHQVPQALRHARMMRRLLAAMWIFTLLAAISVLLGWPAIIPHKTYSTGAIATVIVLWSLVLAVRLIRTPDSVLLQAAGHFKPLAQAGLASSVVSLTSTAALLFLFGPTLSLVGIFAGDMVMTVQIRRLYRRWRRAHG